MSYNLSLSKNQRKVLNKLIDQYEKSVTFQGVNKVNQSFYISIGKQFPKYLDDSEYDFFSDLNEEMLGLKEGCLIELVWSKNRIDRVILDIHHLEDAYNLLGRVPKKTVNNQILLLFNEVEDKIRELHNSAEENAEVSIDRLNLEELYYRYINGQRERISCNKSVEFYDNLQEYRDIWSILIFLLGNEEEIYVRDLSVKMFNDSKRLEAISNKIESILYKYGEYPEKASILEEHNIIRVPSYVMIKGNVAVSFYEQRLDISRLSGDIALSTETLKNVTGMSVLGSRVVTIENLTSFHRYDCKKTDVAVYLGGFHNRVKRDFLKMLYAGNPQLTYCHFGDIDAGGFYIYEHLKKKTGIPFKTVRMDADTLISNSEYAKELTNNDRVRLEKLLEMYKENSDDNYGIIKTMLELGIKLEQEAVW